MSGRLVAFRVLRIGSFWWAAMSVVLMSVGAVGPWAELLGARSDGHQDEVVLALAVIAGAMLLLLAVSGRWWIAVVPLVAGLAATALTGNDIRNVRALVPDASDRHVTLEWGIYLALVGSLSLILSLAALVIDGRRASALARRPLSRKEFVALARAHTPYVASELPTRFLLVPTGDRHLSKLLHTRRTKDLVALQRAVTALTRAGIGTRGTTFLDVGANIGQTTLAALQAGFGSVVAFEPVAETFKLLRANVALNEADERVQTVHVGLSDRSGREHILLTPQRLGSSRLPADENPGAEVDREEVRLARLDDLVAEGVIDPASIGLLWVDTEGHEVNVLRGAEQTLAQGVPVVVELNPRVAEAEGLDEISALLCDCYSCFVELRHKGTTVFGADDLARLIDSTRNHRRTTDVLAFNPPSGKDG
jgi:FkbM family methyltransferase